MRTRKICWLAVIFFGLAYPALRAGSVITLVDAPEADGKLVLKPDAVHVDSSSPADITFSNILEARFSNDDFHLDYFASGSATPQLPPGWKSGDMGKVQAPGAVSFAGGIFKLSAQGVEGKEATNSFFSGQPWTGDGRWTVHIVAIDPPRLPVQTGLMLREGFGPGLAETSLGIAGLLDVRKQFSGTGILFTSTEMRRHGAHPNPISMQLPVWLRLTRVGDNLQGDVSPDGASWQTLYESASKFARAIWVGLFLNNQKDQGVSHATLDQVRFTPGPCAAQILSPGALLQGGSLLAGVFDQLDAAGKKGNFQMDGRFIDVPRDKVAAVIFHPMDRGKLIGAGAQPGLIMKNGDMLGGETQSITKAGVMVNSLLLGIVPYDTADVLACDLQPLQEQPSPYEVRLTNGSILRASGFAADKAGLMVHDISGLDLRITSGQVAQFRAGETQVQNLLELPWQTPAKAAPASVAPAPPADPNAPAPDAAPAAPPPDFDAQVECWEGNNQEQILAAPGATPVTFPLTGRFRALGVWLALSPNAAPGTQVAVHILADGNDTGSLPPLRVGDAPRFELVTLHEPKSLTLTADAAPPGIRVLFIDPVAIREN